MSVSPPRVERPFDLIAMAHVLRRLLGSPAPWLHAEVARRMAQRLSLIKVVPERFMEWWPALGGAEALLMDAYPKAHRIAVEPHAEALTRAQRPAWWTWRHWTQPTSEWVIEGEAHTVAGDGVQLIWANMMLHAVADPPALMARWHELLAVDGFVMFSCLGPGSLRELRDIYARHGWGPSHADLVDMHDLGDMLVQAGFADPVMDQETLTLTWADPKALLAELRQWGGNVSSARFAGLRSPRWLQQLCAALTATSDAAGRIPLSIEVVYGHAFKAPPKVPVAAETKVSLDAMRGLVRRARTTDGV